MDLKPIPSSQGPIDVLFEDTHLLVLAKPPGLLSQGDVSGDENLVDVLRQYFGRNYVGLVHRLDRNVSGLMVVGKRSKAADRLSEALRNGSLIRKYTAWVSGIPSEVFELRNFLRKDEQANEVKVVAKSTAGAKEALLKGRRVRVIEGAATLFGTKNLTPISEVELELETGRSHQIRVQLAAAGHPILNDGKYGGMSIANRERGSFTPPPIFLHSSFLSFPHPMSKELQTHRLPPRWETAEF